MSDTVRYRGKLLPTRMSLDEFLFGNCLGLSREEVMEAINEKYIVDRLGMVWAVVRLEAMKEYEHQEHYVEDGTGISFDCTYYDGGCHWSQLLQEHLESKA